MIFAKVSLAPFMPYIIGGGLLVLVGGSVGAYLWHGAKVDAVINEAVLKERTAWEQEASRLRAVAATEALARVAAVNAAHDADTQRNAALERLLAPINDKVNDYAKSPNGRAVCLSADGRLLAQQAIDAANASIAASPGARR